MGTKKLLSLTKISEINKIVKDLSTSQGRTESEVIEDILLSSLLPKNKDARYLVEASMYRNDPAPDQDGIAVLLQSLFSNNSAGIGKEWSSRYDNYLPLVEFAKRQTCLYNRSQLTGEERELPHLILQLKAIIDRLQGTEKEYAIALKKELEEEPQFTRLGNLYQLVLNSWDDIKGWSITYRFLADLVAVDTWKETAEARIELLEIVKNVSDEWDN